MSATDDASYLSEFDHLTLVRLLIAQQREHPDTGAIDQAVRLLVRLLAAAETSGRGGSALEIGMLQALAQDAQGHRPQALESLAEAWAGAPEPEGYVRLFLDEGAPMVELLRDVGNQSLAGDHARGLLSLSAAAKTEAPDSGQRPAPSSAYR